MSAEVLFIIHDNYQSFNHLPLGPAYIAKDLINNNMTVETYCMDVFHYSNDDLAKHLDENEYSVICLGFMAARYKETIRPLAKVINEHKKKAWFMVGGHMPSADPVFVKRDLKCDEVYVGSSVDIRNYTSPAWDIFPMDKYTTCFKAPGMVDGDKMLSMVTSTGCINKCSFCQRIEKGMKIRAISDVVVEMTSAIQKYGVNYFYILDELFVVSKKRIKEWHDAVKPLGIKYTCEARADIFDDDIARYLKDSGCQFVNIGFESGTQKILDEIGKNVTIEQNINTLETCKRHGLATGLNFIWGFPSDDKETLFKNVELIKKYNEYNQIRTIRPVTPYPGTPLYEQAVREGLLGGPEDFFNRFKNSDRITVNFTKFSDAKCYEWLLEANNDLIKDHYLHTANDLVTDFKDLYTDPDYKFRGARTYGKT